MATFKLILGLPENYYPVPPTTAPVRGDGFLLVERPLIDPKNMQPVGRLIARVTWMDIPTSGDKLNFGHADHRLTHTKKKGVISIQGSWRDGEKKPVFAITGGTGAYRKARGTVTYEPAVPSFIYDVD